MSAAEKFETWKAKKLENPSIRVAYEGRGLIETLRKVRVEQGLSQRAVARRMGVNQSTVSQFESTGNDPRLSTVLRYTHALGAGVRIEVSALPSPTEGGDQS